MENNYIAFSSLGLLTIKSVEKLVNLSDSNEKNILTDILTEELLGSAGTEDLKDEVHTDKKAKLIPFERVDDENLCSKVENFRNIEVTSYLTDDEVKDAWRRDLDSENDEKVMLFSVEDAPREDNVVTVSNFILDEQTKSLENQRKLKEIEVMKLYKKTASERVRSTSSKKTGQIYDIGIILNKKTG